jgi:hypothetical protein
MISLSYQPIHDTNVLSFETKQITVFRLGNQADMFVAPQGHQLIQTTAALQCFKFLYLKIKFIHNQTVTCTEAIHKRFTAVAFFIASDNLLQNSPVLH